MSRISVKMIIKKVKNHQLRLIYFSSLKTIQLKILLNLSKFFSSINETTGEIQDAKQARELLIQYQELIGKNTIQTLFRALFENCSSIKTNTGKIQNPALANTLLIDYKDLIQEDFQDLAKPVIEFYGEIIESGEMRDSFAARNLLEKCFNSTDISNVEEGYRKVINESVEHTNNEKLIRSNGSSLLSEQYPDITAVFGFNENRNPVRNNKNNQPIITIDEINAYLHISYEQLVNPNGNDNVFKFLNKINNETLCNNLNSQSQLQTLNFGRHNLRNLVLE